MSGLEARGALGGLPHQVAPKTRASYGQARFRRMGAMKVKAFHALLSMG